MNTFEVVMLVIASFSLGLAAGGLLAVHILFDRPGDDEDDN